MSDRGPEGGDGAQSAADAAAREAQASLERIEQGGIPLAAERRLRELSEGAGSFTSDLSVADFALCRQVGLRPLAQVMGSSIYQIGYQAAPWPSTFGGGFMFELQTLSDAWNEVRGRAIERLSQEATLLGADAVIGVDLRTGEHDWAENSIEYVILGTAVHREGTPHSATPVLSELSVADYAKLARAGIEPLGIVAWSSAFFVRAAYATQMFGGSGFMQNQELGEFTQGVYAARESVMGRMTEQAARLHASGVIGARIRHGISRVSVGGGRFEQGGLMVTFHAIGTAVREGAVVVDVTPKTTIDLTL